MISQVASIEERRVIPVRYEGFDVFRIFASFGVVLFHIYKASDLESTFSIPIRLRDCAIPFFILASIFILTQVLIRKSEFSFSEFFNKRFKRLWIPFFVWTIIYTLMWSVVFPLLRWNTVSFPPVASLLTRIFSGYMHLWFLQFLFISSLIVYPVVKIIALKKIARWKIVALCLSAAVIHGLLLDSILDYTTSQLLREADVSLLIFVNQTIINSFFVPAAIVLALYSGEINRLYERRIFRVLGLIVLFAAIIVYVGAFDVPYSLWIYSLMVFIAVLQPWKVSSKIVSLLASYSYAVYILHLLPVEVSALIIRHENIELTGAFLLIWSVGIYLATFGLAFLLRKTVPYDWFLPLILVGSRENRGVPADK